MSKNRVKKRFTSDVNVIDFHAHIPAKKQRVNLLPRNKHQEAYLFKLHDENKNILFAIGPAGTGKTLLAVQMGIKLYQEGKIDKIIVTRPAVSVDEDLGFLPGTLNEKMAPWTRPIFDVLGEYYQQKDIEKMQNATQNQMKMLLTRLGENSKMVVTGDLNQADRLKDNGLVDFIDKIKGHRLDHIDAVYFDSHDIERHEAVKEVLDIYGDD